MMEIKKKMYGTSVSEMIKLTLFILFIVNVLAFIYALLLGESFTAIFRSAWIILIGYPVAHGLIQTRINRNGVLILTQYDGSDLLKKEIKHIAERIGYEIKSESENHVVFRRLSFINRLLNPLYPEDFSLDFDGDSAKIQGKRNSLYRIEKGLREINK
jgi:hypothetical protein